jgi:hypothetical protein
VSAVPGPTTPWRGRPRNSSRDSRPHRPRRPGRRCALRLLWSEEDGSTLLLSIFFGALSLALVLLVVAATSLYLERKRLFTLADGAALAAAESFPLESVSRDDAGRPRPVLRSSEVEEAARVHLAHASPDFDDLRLLDAETTDGRSARVSLSCSWAPPVVSLLVPGGVRVEVSATARSVLR